MKNTILLFFFCFACFASQAQFGFSYSRNILSSDGLHSSIGSASGFPNGSELSIDYLHRFKGLRIELLPELGYSRHVSTTVLSSTARYQMNTLLAQLNVNIYPFDLDGDCDCPTWGREGGLFEKGFFVQGTGGYSWNSINLTQIGTLTGMGNDSAFFGAGVGLDIGVFKEITITPMVNYHYFLKNSFLDPDNLEQTNPETPYSELTFGVRLGIWLRD